MPQPVLHVFLAKRTLAHWRRTRERAPFRLDDPVAANAFMHGSLGPDMGLFPWSEGLISRLAHESRTGALGRALVESARTDVQRAFAWGWVSHILADAAIHPLVNDAAGRLDPNEAVADASFLVRHVTVEVGLDACYVRRMPEVSRQPLRDVFGPDDVVFLGSSLLRICGVAFDRRTLLASHRNVTRFYRLYLLLQRVIAEEQACVLSGSGEMPVTLKALRFALSRFVTTASPSFGFLHPLVPTRRLLKRVDAAVRDFDDRLDGLLDGGLAELPDYNLETGEIAETSLDEGSAAFRSPTPRMDGAPAAASNEAVSRSPWRRG